MKGIKAVGLDLDGTVLNSLSAIHLAIKEWFVAHRLEPPTYQNVIDQLRERDLKGMLLALLPSNYRNSSLDFVAKEIVSSYVNFYMPRYAVPIDGAIELITDLKIKGYRIGIVSNGTRPVLDLSLKRFNLCRIVDIAISADEVSEPKPHPMGILKFLGQFSIEPVNALFMGDAPTDMLASKAAGVLSVGVLSGVGEREELRRAGADFVINSVASLPQIIRV